MPNLHETSSPSENFGRGYSNPLPTVPNATGSVCNFDGGTRFSVVLDPGVGFWHFQRGVLSALEEHNRTRQPVSFGPSGFSVRGASRAELSYFRDLPDRGVVIQCDDFRAIIRDSVIERVSCPSRNDCVVILGWHMFTHTRRVSDAFERVCDALRGFGFVPRLDCINRVDVNVTVDNVPMSFVWDAFAGGLIVTRSKPRLVGGNSPGKLETLYYGWHDSPVMLRVYDKSAELRSSLKTDEGRAKLRALREQFSECSLTRLTRFEFEIHKSCLNDYAVRDFRDLENKLSAMLEYLTDRWIRVLETRPANNRHRDRQRVAHWWATVADSLQTWAVSLTENPAQVNRAKHVRTSGVRSSVRSFAWLKIAALECLSIDRETLDKNGRESTIDALVARLAYALKTSPELPPEGEWGTGPELAWNYALQKFEV